MKYIEIYKQLLIYDVYTSYILLCNIPIIILSYLYQYDISMIYLWLIVLHLRVPWDDPGRSGRSDNLR